MICHWRFVSIAICVCSEIGAKDIWNFLHFLVKLKLWLDKGKQQHHLRWMCFLLFQAKMMLYLSLRIFHAFLLNDNFSRQNHPNVRHFFRTDELSSDIVDVFGWSRNFFPTKMPTRSPGGWRHLFPRPVLHRSHTSKFSIHSIRWLISLLQLLQRGPSQRKWWRPKKGWFKTLNKVKILKSPLFSRHLGGG